MEFTIPPPPTSQLLSSRWSHLVGSSKPLVGVACSLGLQSSFGWLNDPSVRDVLLHLQNVTRCYTPQEKSKVEARIKRTRGVVGVGHGQADHVKK
jgi:hypothetical protein